MLIPIVLGGAALLYFVSKKKPPAAQAQTVTGRSGTPWAVAPTRSGTDPVTKKFTTIWTVYLLPAGTPIMDYSQVGDDKNSRQFVMSNRPATDSILMNAKADFIG